MIDFQNVTFTYPGAEVPALQQVNLKIAEGAFCLVFGPSGGGKSTLLRCTNGLVPHFSGGKLEGTINIFGLDPLRLSPHGMSRAVGFVFQDPEAQFVVDRVEDEIAFALENLAMPAAEIEERVTASLELLELQPLRSRRLETLSGGEKQRVAIAAALVLQPRLLVLDEPTSQLDPHSAEEVLQALARLNSQLGLTILLAEHRLERVLPFTTQAVYLQAGQPGVIAGEPRDVLLQVPINPPVVSLGKALGWRPLPVTIEEARHFASQLSFIQDRQAALPDKLESSGAMKHGERQPFLQAVDVEVSYGSNPALRRVSLELYPGEITALMGPNGSGKTTLLRCLVGLIRPRSGEVRVEGQPVAGQKVSEISHRVGYLPQDPNALLFADTVEEELLLTLRNHDLTPGAGEVSDLLGRLGLGEKAFAYPRDLSAGERQRVALAAVLVAKPGALLLDEPTRGLDYTAKRALLDLLRRWRGEGMAVLLVTHDVELVAEVADRVILLEGGRLITTGKTREVLTKSEKFAPQMVRLFSQSMLLTVREVLESRNLKVNTTHQGCSG